MRPASRPLHLLAAVAIGATACSPTPPEAAPSRWQEGETHGRWQVEFTGFGAVTGSDDDVTLAPDVAVDPDKTHGALVVDYSAPTDLALTITVRTVAQLRVGRPNPWEVGWVLWRFTDPDHFYAVVLKPNGWELSKQDPAYPGKQRFLASGESPAFPVGTEHTLDIVQVGDATAIRANNTSLITFRDAENPYPEGGVGLYTEDAKVRFRVTSIAAATALPPWTAPATPASPPPPRSPS